MNTKEHTIFYWIFLLKFFSGTRLQYNNTSSWGIICRIFGTGNWVNISIHGKFVVCLSGICRWLFLLLILLFRAPETPSAPFHLIIEQSVLTGILYILKVDISVNFFINTSNWLRFCCWFDVWKESRIFRSEKWNLGGSWRSFWWHT